MPASGRVQAHEVPGNPMACAVRRGPYATLNQADDAVFRWIEANGHRVAGPSRDVY